MRIEQLTFTRFIAAIAIVIYHYGDGSSLFHNKYTSFFFQQANIGVSYFYILSGFVMIIAYENRDTINFREYLKNRLARIYPVYLLSLFLVIAIKIFENISLTDLLLNLLMLQSWIPGKALTLNFPGWSLSVEMFFYIIFPFLVNRIYSKQRLRFNVSWIVLFWLISQIIYHLIAYEVFKVPFYSKKDMMYYPLLHFNEFLIGNLAGLIFIKKLIKHKKNYLGIIVFVLLILILVLKFPIGLDFHNGLLAVIFVPLILLISLSNDKLTKMFSKPRFAFLGKISFGIYILQVPVWSAFPDYKIGKYLGMNVESDFTILFFIRLLILVLLSILSYLYFEKPARNMIKNYLHV